MKDFPLVYLLPAWLMSPILTETYITRWQNKWNFEATEKLRLKTTFMFKKKNQDLLTVPDAGLKIAFKLEG